MRPRHFAPACLVLLALPAGAQAAPQIVSAQVQGNPLVGEPLTVVVVASDPKKAVTGLEIQDPDGATFAESACLLNRDGKPSKRGAFKPGHRVRFELPYTPSQPGIRVLNTKVTSGGCGTEPESSSTRLAVTVTLPSVPTLGDILPPVARSSAVAMASASCKGTNTVPNASNARTTRSALLCLVNAQRRANGLPIVRTAKKLRDAAIFHSSDMVRRGYFGHAGPGGPDLATRLRRFGYWPAIAGENIGRSSGNAATPAAMVNGWMHSEPHRTNILTGNFRAVGIGISPSGGAATYTAIFARR